ncbi:MAG: hypothetical protein KatS3mg017_0727 [Fimbriimonadales bacterium]|nr:MAG: hypothetical protein KatS3mg017_0727 [Fimbriimonadales bacterium]
MQGKIYRYKWDNANPQALWDALGVQGEAWWFGWSETEMYLPQRLNGTLPDADWERLSLFNEHAELRLLKLDTELTLLLLTEQGEPPSNEWQPCAESYEVHSTHHILLGDPPKSAGGETTQLADVAFPRMFDYGIALQTSKQNTHKVVLKVRYYYDAAHRLRFVRCAELDKHSW